MFQTFRLSVFFVCGQFMVYCLIKSLEVIVLKLKKKQQNLKCLMMQKYMYIFTIQIYRCVSKRVISFRLLTSDTGMFIMS